MLGQALYFQCGLRRIVVNACDGAAGLEKKISATRSVEFVAPYSPHAIGVRRIEPYLS